MSSLKGMPEFLTSFISNNSPEDLVVKGECHYTKYFCEENVWMMVKRIQDKSPEKLKLCHPVFISNDYAHIPLWRQSASSEEDGLVVWDYHVIMVYCDEEESWVYDYDSQLPFPTKFKEYCEETFKTDELLKPIYHRLFRVLSAESYLKYFSSDRRHMKNDDGTWKKPPPSYPIINSDKEHNLESFISMKDETNHVKFGCVLNLKSFVERFSLKAMSSSIDYMYPPKPSFQ